MKTTSLRARTPGHALRRGASKGILCALLAGTAFCGLTARPAAAQSANTPQAHATAPADHLLVTPNGVDLRSGRFDYRQTDLAIGGEGDSGLQLTRIARGGIWGHVEPFANFSHNLDIMIAEKRVNIATGNYQHQSGTGYRMIVRFGGRSETFDGHGPTPFYERISRIGTAKLTYSGSASSGSVVYTFQAADGTLATFRPLGNGDCSDRLRCAYISQVELPDGTRLSFDYENPTPGTANSTRLRSVVSTRGYALLLEYGGGGRSWNSISKACVINLALRVKPADNACPADAPATAYYGYASLHERLLASSTDATGATSLYQHGLPASFFTIGFVKPGQATPWLTNHYARTDDEDGVRELVVRQDVAGGQVYNMEFRDGSDETENQVRQLAGGDIVDAEGHRIIVRYGFPVLHRTLAPGFNPEIPEELPNEGSPRVYQITPGPVAVTDELGRTTHYEYCDPDMAAFLAPSPDNCVVRPLLAYTDPEGIRSELTYDAFGNVTRVERHPGPGSLPSLGPTVVTTTFACFSDDGTTLTPKSCTKPKSVTDAKGHVTTYSYAPEHGGVLKETGPAVGGVTAQKRYSYAQRFARIADGAGGFVQAPSPVWLPTQMALCRTGNPAESGPGCAIAGDEVVTTYDYGPESGPNNLLLRATTVTADGISLRGCVSHDALGNKLSETTPRGGASCP